MKKNIINETIRKSSKRKSSANILAALGVSLAFTGMAAAAPVTCEISPERSVLLSGKPESAIIKVALTGGSVSGKDRPAVNMSLVIDRSGSMNGDRIEKAIDAAVAAVERLEERDLISVVVFDDSVNTIVPAQSAENRKEIISKIREIRVGGSTAIFGGVSQAASEIRKNLQRKLVNRIILLSDGQANVGPSSPDELGRLGVALVKEGISVSTIGVGLGYNEDLMTRLAGKSDGNSYFVENNDELPKIFDAELGDVLSVAAKSVKLSVRFKDGATPVEIIGRDGRIADNTVSVDFNQIYSRQEKYVLIRTEFAVGKNGDSLDFADAEVKYEIPDSGETSTALASGKIRFSGDSGEVKKSVDKDVIVQAVRNINAINSAKAIELNDSGDYEKSSEIYSGNFELTQKMAEKYDIQELKNEQAHQEKMIGVSKIKLSGRMRKSARSIDYSTMNQQKTSADEKGK